MHLTRKSRVLIIVLTAIFLAAILSVAIISAVNTHNSQSLTPPDISTPDPTPDPTPPELFKADIYVSVTGQDTNSGLTKDSPLATIEKAIALAISTSFKQENAHLREITIALIGGNYSPITLTNVASNIPIIIKPFSTQKATFSQSKTLDASSFVEVQEPRKSMLFTPNKNNVYQTNLYDLGLTLEQIGTMYAVGKYTSEPSYLPSNTQKIIQTELYIGGERQLLARYPNGERMLNIGEVISAGKHVPKTASPGGKFYIDDDASDRVAGYNTLKDVWLYGYFGNDWADNSTKINEFDATNKTIETTYAHNYSYKKGCKYNFYNVFEELDSDGEYYIDRETGQMYIYSSNPLTDNEITLSVGNSVPISLVNCTNIVLDGLELDGTKTSALSITKGKNITVQNCTIRKVSGNGINITDSKSISIIDNQIVQIGTIGINLKNAINKPTLEPDNNLIKGNQINNFGQIMRTYAPAISLNGVGNIAKDNTIHTAPHTAIMFTGNNNQILYNHIYDVCLFSGDCGAIYAGRSYSYYGNVIKGNYLHDIGSGNFKPNAIYLDDYLSGQTVVQNVIANVGGNGILAGGGRDNTITNNILLNAKLSFDHRAYQYYVNNSADYHDFDTGSYWGLIKTAQRLNTLWGNPFPSIASISMNPDDYALHSFGVNPSNNIISNNFFGYAATKYIAIYGAVTMYSQVNNNIAELVANSNFDITKTHDLPYMATYLDTIFTNNLSIERFELFNSQAN